MADAAGDLKRLGEQIDSHLQAQHSLDYWESSAWAARARPVVDSIRAQLGSATSPELVRLIEQAISCVTGAVLLADDSNGEIGGLLGELLDLHLVACNAGAVDPAQLASWMIHFIFEAQDFFVLDPKRYAGALGETGLAAFRWQLDRRRGAGERTYALTYAEERLAVLDGDIDRIIELLGGSLTSPHQFAQVTAAMVELGRDDDALAWARRGIAETQGWEVAQLFDMVAGVHGRRGTLGEVVAVRWEEHRRMASSTTYGLLRDAAEQVGIWETERDSARSILEAQDLGGLVDALLLDQEPAPALQIVVSHPEWDPGAGRRTRLAEMLMVSRPDDAMTIYLQLADGELETTGRTAYTKAAAQLRLARRASESAGLQAEFAAHVAALRQRFCKRPALIEILDRSALH